MRINRKNSNKNKWLIIGGVVLAAFLFMGSFIGYNYWQDEQRRKEAEETGSVFVEALENQNYEEISSMISEASLHFQEPLLL